MPTASKNTTFKFVKRTHREAISDRGPSHLFSVISYNVNRPYSFPHKGKLQTKVAQPVFALNIEEGEVLVGEALMALRGGEACGVSSAPPSDKEVEALEGMTFDESGKFHLLFLS